MEGRRDVCADAQRRHHEAQLRDGRIGQHSFDIVLRHRHRCREQRRKRADHRHERQRLGKNAMMWIATSCKKRIQADQREDARRYHRRSMDHRADRCGTFHGIGQPDMQRKLRRLADCADDEKDADDAGGADCPAAEDDWRCGRQHIQGLGVVHDIAVVERAGQAVEIGNAQQHDDIGDARGGEGFDSGFIGAFFFKPEADEHVGTNAHDLPADEEQQHIVRHHQSQHGASKQRNQREEARLARIMRHITNGINENHQHCDGHHDQHDDGGRVDQHTHHKSRLARIHPGDAAGQHFLPDVMQLRGVVERHPADNQRRQHAAQAHADADDAAVARHHRHQHAVIIRMMPAIFVVVAGWHELRLVGQQRDDEECQQRARGDQPGQRIGIVEEVHSGPYPFSAAASSGITERRLRYTVIIIAKPTAASAAATISTKAVKA